MRMIMTIAAIALAAPMAVAQVSGIDTTRSSQDRQSFPDPTLPQADKYIPQVEDKARSSFDLKDVVEESRNGVPVEKEAEETTEDEIITGGLRIPRAQAETPIAIYELTEEESAALEAAVAEQSSTASEE